MQVSWKATQSEGSVKPSSVAVLQPQIQPCPGDRAVRSDPEAKTSYEPKCPPGAGAGRVWGT